jgi:hypothetical protein
MKWRGISESESIRVINNPKAETPSAYGRVNLWENENKKGLKITVIKKSDKIIIVTAIRKE